jgi:metal-responsive CopG/Arc/MetJ family transcriptional regulator
MICYDKKYDKTEVGMIKKRKISITIDKELLESMDLASRVHKIAKSQLAQEAITLWLKMKTDEQMAKGYEEQAKEDIEFIELATKAQNEVFNE